MAANVSPHESPFADVDVLVVGARGSVDREAVIDAIHAATENRDASAQAFDPDAVYGAKHLEAAARRAVRSHREDRAIARNLPVEIACYAAGIDQIDDALEIVGLPASADGLVLCALGDENQQAVDDVLERLDLESDDTLVEPKEVVLERLGISETARELADEGERQLLVTEHVALLDARR